MRSKRRFVDIFVLGVFLCIVPVVSAATPWLHVDANQIKDPSGNRVVLRGVALIDIGAVQLWRGGVTNLIDRLTNPDDSQGNYTGWGTKIVRLAVYPTDGDFTGGPWYFQTNPDNYYNNLLRPVVDYCKTKDLYVIIDWHYVGVNTFDKVSSTSAFWTYIAPKFANDSHVLFELFNEPLNTSGANDAAKWESCRVNMQAWTDIIRASAPDNLILVGCPQWSQIIAPTATNPVTGGNIVYVSHIYPDHWGGGSGTYVTQIKTAVAAHPVMVTEWGFILGGAVPTSGTLTGYGLPFHEFREDYGISHTAWCADYDWGPPMFNSDWTLRCGENYMGCFTKDILYEMKDADQPSENDTVPPAAPTGLSAIEGNGVVSLNWSNNGESDLAGYNVYRSTVSGGPYTKLNTSLLSSSDYTDNSVTNGTTYYYIVTAEDTSSNESDNSDEVPATPYADTTPPVAPTGLGATPGEGTVSLNWNDNSESDLAGYNVYRSTVSGGPYTKLNGALLSNSDYIDNSVTNGTPYYYVVRAVDTSSNESGNSTQASATPVNLPPAVPTGLGATAGSGTVSLNWNDNGEGDLAGYNIYRSTTSGSGYSKQNGSLLVSSNYTDNSVFNGVTYYYVVTAVDTALNESGYSSQVSATPQIVTDVNILGSWVSGTSHTKESGTSRALIFIAHAEEAGAINLSSVTYGGQTMTKVLDTIVGTSYQAYVVAYILNEAGIAAATSGTFVPTWSVTPDNASYGSVFVQNADQTDIVGATASNSINATTPTTITTAALSTKDGDMVVVAATCGNTSNYTVNSGFMEALELDMGSSTGVEGYKFAIGANETPSVTNDNLNRQVLIGFVINAQTGSGYSNCGEVLAGGHRLVADIAGSGDCYVDYYDLDTLVDYWLNTTCSEPDNCHGADFEPTNGAVDLFDLGIFAGQWLTCNDPEGINCTPNW